MHATSSVTTSLWALLFACATSAHAQEPPSRPPMPSQPATVFRPPTPEAIAEVDMVPRGGQRRIISVSEMPDGPLKKNALENLARKDEILGARVFRGVSEAEVAFLERRKAYLKSYDEIKSNTAVTLYPVDEVQSGAKLLGYIPSGVRPGTPTTRMARLFELSGGRLLQVMEHDYVASGGGVLQIRESFNQRVNDEWGILVVSVSLSGKALWQLTWSTSNKSVSIELGAPTVAESDRDWLLAFARSLK